MDMGLGGLQELVMDDAWHAAVPWGHKESDMTERLNWTDWIHVYVNFPIQVSLYKRHIFPGGASGKEPAC